jgi:hypothetical protein
MATTVIDTPTANGKISGVRNGESYREIRSETQVNRNSRTQIKTKTENYVQFTADQQITVLIETIITTRGRLVADIDHVQEHTIDNATIEGFLDYIERERLTHMPHRGSTWDRVLKWAEFFALQVSAFENVVKSFVPESENAAKLIWIASRALLELGPNNAQALEATFRAFYKLGLSMSFLLRHTTLLSVNGHLRKNTAEAFNHTLMLVVEVGIYYHKRINDITFGSVKLDFNQVFGRHLEEFAQRKYHIIYAMWGHELGNDASGKVRTLRTWLSPRDQTLQTIFRDRRESIDRREEYTCEWFQRYLLDFSRGKDNVLAVTGPAGCGKSVLFGWIVERLQSPLGRKTYETISYSIQGDFPSKSTSLALVKNLCLQLLETNIGDRALFSRLLEVYDTSVATSDPAKLEMALWEALDAGLSTVASRADNLMIVIDGLDEIHGEEKDSNTAAERLEALASKYKSVQVTILSRNFPSKKAAIQSIQITADHTHNDLHRVIEHTLHGHTQFRQQSEMEREAVVEQLVHHAKGSFLWAILTIELLEMETTHNGFMKFLKDAPKSLEDTIQKITSSLNFSKSDTKHLFAWLLVAERPLKLAEVKCLLQVDLERETLVERKGDLHEDIRHACGGLVTVQNSIVAFRHRAIRSFLLKHSAKEKKALACNDAHADLTLKLVAYCRLCTMKSSEPTFEHKDISVIDELFRIHSLLEYAVRNWTLHFQNSTIHKNTGGFELSSKFKSLFPSSTELVMAEWACWEAQTSGFQAVILHDLALRIREQVFTEKHDSVLQNLIVCGSLNKKLCNFAEAGACYYRASHIGQAILPKYSMVVTNCAVSFLTCTESITSTSRTELVTRKEMTLKYLILARKQEHGTTSDIVIRYYKMLVQLYIDIHEDHQAEATLRELHEVIISRHGKGSEEETSISKELVVVLKKGKKEEDVVEYERDIFETSTTMDLWDTRRIKITLELALSYEASGKLLLAEELYVTLWRRLTGYCHQAHHHHGVEIYISTIDIALEYVRFLRRLHRHEEACSILICIWTEYEEYNFDSEVLFFRLKVLGELMRAVSLLSIAASVFKKCWTWFKAHGEHEHTRSCELLISETVEEIIQTVTQTTKVATSTTVTQTTKVTTSTATETIIKEVFESAVSRTTVSSETISICRSLISFYMKLEQWTKAIEVTKRSLTIIWKMIISGGGTIALPREFDSEAIDMAINLAICHHHSQHFFEAEEIYMRIYRACRVSCHIHDERLTKSYTVLIKFYEEHRHWQKIIRIYQELLTEYRKHLGSSHALTIKTLYILGSLCSEHGHGNSLDYYEEIITTLNGTKHVCHHDAADAMIVLCQKYYEDGSWDKLRSVCKVMWETWTKHHHQHKFDSDSITILYKRYIYVLENHSHCEYGIIRTISMEFRNVCVEVFGVSSAVTIDAMIELAQVCLRSEKHIHEAIQLYEEIITKVTSTETTTTTTTTTKSISTTTITTVKERLAKAYVTVCLYGTASTATIEKAIKVMSERLEQLKITLGCAHSETLTMLREIVLLRKKLKTQEAHAILHMLQDTVIEIITKEKHSKTLHDAAITLGELYLQCELSKHGLEILHEMRRQIITRTFSDKKYGFKINKSVDKTSYVFIVTMERILRGTMTVSYSEIMTDLLTEVTLYENYNRCIKSETDVTIILIHAARLRAFLVTHHDDEQRQSIEKATFEVFLKKWGTFLKTRREITFVFYGGLLKELSNEGSAVPLGRAACMASTEKVRELLEHSKFQEAYGVASCAFQFIDHLKAYHHLHYIGHGFKLSAYMAGRGVKNASEKTIEPELRKQMLELSRTIIRAVLQACKDSNINFVRLHLGELNDLVGLLGEQQNHVDLEWLLNSLWLSREVQKTWSATMIISIGRRLVQARFLAGHDREAIRLCEDICYNLRRSWGVLDPKTLEMLELMSQLYTYAGHYREAMAVHEEILRHVVEGDDGDDRTPDTMSSQMARKHFDLLKRSYLRLGGWDKSPSTYKDLVQGLISMEEYKGKPEWQGVQNTDKWTTKEQADALGTFVAPKEWEFVDPESVTGGELKGIAKHERPKMGVKRATSNWGMGLSHDLMYGRHEQDGHAYTL